MRSRFNTFRLVLPLLAVLVAPARAATHVVDSVAALQERLAAAGAGDTITIRNGAYELPADFRITVAGADGRPLTITAETIGGVELRGPGGFAVATPAAYVVIRGFKFAGAAGRSSVGAGTRGIRFSRNVFACTGEGPYLTVTGDGAEVDYNEFRDKRTLGNMISVTGVGSQVARGLWIHHNYFHDFANAHGNGAETIRFGLSGLSMSNGGGIVEHNLFERCTGENELISNKSCGNTYRYNTFLSSPGAQLTLRHGNECLVYGNFFRGLDGLRIFGDRHWIFSNYFEGNTRGINLGNGDGEVADGAKLTSHDRPDDCVVAFNTLVNNGIPYQMDARKGGMGATRTTFAYNLVQGTAGDVSKIGGPNPGAVYRGNILCQTGAPGDLPAGSHTTVDFLLRPDARGIFRLPPAAPIFGSVNDPAMERVNVDLDGQPRTAKKTPGADEPGDGGIGRLLTASEVGPLAK